MASQGVGDTLIRGQCIFRQVCGFRDFAKRGGGVPPITVPSVRVKENRHDLCCLARQIHSAHDLMKFATPSIPDTVILSTMVTQELWKCPLKSSMGLTLGWPCSSSPRSTPNLLQGRNTGAWRSINSSPVNGPEAQRRLTSESLSCTILA